MKYFDFINFFIILLNISTWLMMLNLILSNLFIEKFDFNNFLIILLIILTWLVIKWVK